MNTILQYAQTSFQLNSCILSGSRIVEEHVSSPFASVMLHQFISSHFDRKQLTALYIPDHFSGYFSIYSNISKQFFLFGPYLRTQIESVTPTNYVEKYHIRISQKTDFLNFLHALPLYDPEHIRTVIGVLYELLNSQSFSECRLTVVNRNLKKRDSLQYHVSSNVDFNFKQQNVSFLEHTSKLVQHAIKHGEPSRLLFEKQPDIISPHMDYLSYLSRDLKTDAIMTLACVSLAAVEGGLDYALSRQVTDMYLELLKPLTDMDDIFSLCMSAMIDFATRVQNIQRRSDLPAILRKALSYIQEHLYGRITVQQIASDLHVNASYLSRLFSKEMGISLTAYIAQEKIKEAQRLLADTAMPLSEIAYQLGYSSQNHFQRAFKKVTGTTPNQYRNHPS